MRIALLLAVLGGGAVPQAGPGVTVDREGKAVRVPCRIAPRKLPNLPDVYPIEVLATLPAPKGQKAHETAVVVDAAPSEVHKALESLGLKPGRPGRGDEAPAGPELEVILEIAPARQVRIERILVDRRTGRPLPPVRWHFTGSVRKEGGVYAADASGTLVTVFPVTDEAVIQSSLTMRDEGMLKLETAKDLLPPEGTAATLVLRAAAGRPREVPPAAPPDPEGAVLKLSRRAGPVDLAPPPVAVQPIPVPVVASDPFEHRREARPPASLADSIRPVEAPLPPLPRGAAPGR